MSYSTICNKRIYFAIIALLGLIALSSACQPGNEATPFPTESPVAATPIQALLQTRMITQEGTNNAEEPGTSTPRSLTRPTETAIISSPTASPGPSVTPTPLPEPTFYEIQSGDTLIGIAEQFDLSADELVLANGFTSLGEVALVVGNELQIPSCEAHQIMPGNTLTSIAQLCGVTLDELIIANIKGLASIGTLEGVPLGFVLYIPEATFSDDEIDCNVQPARAQVIEYQPSEGEGPFCLGQKFSVAATAIIQGNVERLTASESYGEIPLLIPPRNGALYRIGPDDIQNGVTVEDIANWYDVESDAITDWNGNLVGDPLRDGQQLFIDGANLNFGLFRSQSESADSSE